MFCISTLQQRRSGPEPEFSQSRDALSALPPSSWSNSTTAGKEAKFPSLCSQTSSLPPAKKAEQAAINYKEILSSCGRFATTSVSKANRYGVLGSLVPCTAAMPNPGPQILLQQIRERGEEGRFVICMLQHRNSHFIFTSPAQNRVNEPQLKWTHCLPFVQEKFSEFCEQTSCRD